MPELHDLLDRRASGYGPAPDLFDRVLDRRRRRERNRRVQNALVALLVAGVAIGALLRVVSSGTVPAVDPRSPFLGVWLSTEDDGDTHTMTVRPSANGAVEIMVFDEAATLCTGGPSTMTGTGRIEAGTQLVIPAPVYTCEFEFELDPEGLSGPTLQEQLRDWTLSLDPETETLSDSFGSVWRREGALSDLEPLWPQTSFEEARRAQERADAFDPAFTWQIHGEGWEFAQNHPDGAELFARFLEEELGWEAFLWDEAFAHRDGFVAGDVAYIRCAAGRTNPLYPNDPVGRGCAPTIDDLRYETVKIHVAQPVRQGPRGIWVVTDWQMIESVQADPRVVEAEATALLEDFLQARIDGAGAEEFAGLPEFGPFTEQRAHQEIPLLYATSAGASFERSEFEIVDGPEWPSGRMQFEARLFAENGATVVEQLFSLERGETDRPRLVYHFDRGDAGPGPGTTENGTAVPEEYVFLDGEVTYRATYPAAPRSGTIWDQGPDVATVVGAGERRLLLILADPRPIGPGCEEAPAPADAEALARSIRSDPDLEADAPVAVTIGGIPALQIDVVLAPNASSCRWRMPSLSSTTPLLLEHAPFVVQGADRARLYLLDLPGGSARVLAIAIMSDEDSFERALEQTAPILESFEFHPR